MQLSRFNVWVHDHPAPGESLLFNTRTQALIKVSDKFRRSLEMYLHGSGSAVCPEDISDSVLGVLRENGIVVNDEGEDDRKVGTFFQQLFGGAAEQPFEITLLTTFNCNFRCSYCFEESVKDHVYMSQLTSDKVISWLKEHISAQGIKRFHIVYYGGEPLMNLRPIYDVSWHMQAWARETGREFQSSVITNGSLLSEHIVDNLLPVGLQNVRVTVDGMREGHDKKRPFTNGRPSFDIIMKNIKAVIDKVNVGIVGNFDAENVGGIPRFLDYLEAEGILRKLYRLDFAPIAPRLGPKSNPAGIELSGCLTHFGKNGMFDELISIKRELLRRGVLCSTGLGINGCSLLIRDGGMAIDPNGMIYTCNALVGYPEFSVGSVESAGFNRRYGELQGSSPWQRCPKDCAYVPMCQGGCRYFSFLENGNFSDIVCKREFFDAMTPGLIKLEYDKTLAGG